MPPEPHFGERRHREYSFGDFTFDVQHRLLRRGAEEVTLRPKSLEVLAYLVDHPGQLVTRAALIEAVWPDTAVTDNSLAQCMVEIRRVLADDSQQLIRTVARRGYVFAASVTTPVAEFPRPAAEPRSLPVAPAAPGRNALRTTARWYLLGSGAFVLLGMAISGYLLPRPARRELAYTQITNFTDSAVAPALSPDGRMVAFYRSSAWFHTPDQIYCHT